MLESTANKLINHLQERFPANQNYSKEQLDSTPEMPAPVAHYIIQRINHRVTDHVNRIAADSWLDSTDSEVRQGLNDFQRVLEEAVHIPAGEWHEVVSGASREMLAYLVDPVSELTDFVFREQSSLPIARVRRRMAYFSPYSYLHSVFTAYAERKSLENIERARFEQVLDRIDQQMVADYTIEKWERLFEPLFELLAVLSPSREQARAPVTLVRQLAANKQFDALVRQLNQTDSSQVTLADVRELTAAALNQTKSPSAKRSVQKEPQPRPETRTNGPQPRWKQFQQGTTKPSSPSRSPQPRPEAGQIPSDKTGKPLWQRFQQTDRSDSDQQQPEESSPDRSAAVDSSTSPQHTTNQPPTGSLEMLERDVIGVVPDDQRQRFVRQLFSGSQQEYADILAELQTVNSWEHASSLIAKKVFLPHQVNIYSEPAVTFTDLVEARFQQPSLR